MSELMPGKIVRRVFLYVGIALIVLAVFAAFIVLTNGAKVSAGWIGLVGYTSLLLWVTISKSRERWHRPMFWLAVVGLLAVHLLAFAVILGSYPEWRMIWFLPVVVLEAGLFSSILNVLLGYQTKRQ